MKTKTYRICLIVVLCTGSSLLAVNQSKSLLPPLNLPRNILLPVNQKLVFANYVDGGTNISVLTRPMKSGEIAQDYELVQYDLNGNMNNDIILAEGIEISKQPLEDSE